LPSTEVVIAKRFNNLLRPLQVHIHRSTVLAGELAQIHHVDVEACELAAGTHDLFRSEPDFAQISTAEKYGIPIGDIEMKTPMLLHGANAAAWLENEAGLTDNRVLEAVRWHTFGWPEIDDIGKILYLADKLEPGKVTADPSLAVIRNMADIHPDKALLALLQKRVEAQLSKALEVHPLTLALIENLKSN
jgi:predicted HD superfamily hydrolase involved in NAD metabolism